MLMEAIITRAEEVLRQCETEDPHIRHAVQILRDAMQILHGAISVGNITNATGVAIGSNIRQVVQHFNLPPEAAATLIDLRTFLGTSLGIDTSRYYWPTLGFAKKIEDFVGRSYAFDAIDKFLNAHSSGYFEIVGDPGMGKSALLAEYVRRTGCLAHFNVRTLGIISPVQFIENLCAQLIVETGLPYTSLPTNVARDGAFLLKLLHEAAAKLPAGDRLVIAVDALDEVDLTTHPEGTNILFLPPILPDNVYFILTRRDVQLPFSAFPLHDPLDLMHKEHQAENRNDVELYLRHAVERPGLAAWLVEHTMPVDDFVGLLADLSENNFMYLWFVLPEIEEGKYANLRADMLPRGLKGYYETHWGHMGMNANPPPQMKIIIIYIMCELRQPVSRTLLADLANNPDEHAVGGILKEWRQFLHRQETSDGILYSIYHASFRDFLHRQDIIGPTGLTIEAINKLIAYNLWKDIFGDE